MDMPKLLDGRLKLRHLLLVDALSRQGSVVGRRCRTSHHATCRDSESA